MLTPAAGAALARVAERTTGHKPTWIVNSHYHGDHIWGNASFPEGHVVSSRRVRDAVLQRSQLQLDACRREFPKELARMSRADSPVPPVDRPEVRAWYRSTLAAAPTLRIVPPELTFREEVVLQGRRRSIHLITYGGGHSPSDVFAYLPEERIVFTGDLVMVGYHPSVGDGYPDEFIRILREMRRHRADVLLPGHGPVGTGRSLERNLGYWLNLRKAVSTAIRHGAGPGAVAQLPIPRAYRDWRFSFMFPENALRIYRHLRKRAPPR